MISDYNATMETDSSRRIDRIMPWLGIVGFYWYLVTGFSGPDGHRIALALLVAFFIYWVTWNWRVLRASSLCWLAVGLSAYVAARTMVGYWEDPTALEWHDKYGWAFLEIAGLASLVLAPWLTGSKKVDRLHWGFALVVLSLAIQVLKELFVHTDGVPLQRLYGGRPGFQMGPNTFGLLCGILLVGVLALGVRWLQYAAKRWGWWGAAGLGCSLMALEALLLAGLLISESRASWLGTAVALAAMLAAGVWLLITHRMGARRWVPVGLVAGTLVITVGMLGSNWKLVEERVRAEAAAVGQVITLDLDNLPDNSVGNRIRLWWAGVDAMSERPVFGWSPGGIREVIDDKVATSVPHNFHNVPLQIGVPLGVVGFVAFFGMVAISIREVLLALRSGRWSPECGAFWGAALVLLAVEGQFDSPTYDAEYRFMLIFLASLPFGLQLERLAQDRDAQKD